jgi:hypothetical protein
MAPTTNSLLHLALELLTIGLVIYAFMLILLGPTRASRAASGMLNSASVGIGRFVFRLSKVVIMSLVNTSTLLIRLAVSIGRPEQATEAWARYVERMSDLLLEA